MDGVAMGWLWLVSAGTTDVQIQVWAPAEHGEFEPRRLELRRKASAPMESFRAQHEAIAEMARSGQIAFPEHKRIPAPLPRERAAPEGLFFDRENGKISSCELVQATGLAYGLKPGNAKIDKEDKLGLVCPKVEPLLPVLREDLRRLGLSPGAGVVLVLNTRRDNDPEEPVASGPAVSQLIATRLGLNWERDVCSTAPCPGTAGWIDILQGTETYESAEQQIVKRVIAALPARGVIQRVYVTPTGGFPKLKPLHPILAARRYGRERVFVLEEPEVEGRRQVASTPLGTGIVEQQSLRLQAVEQIDRGHWLAAYGIAGAALATRPETPWAQALQRLVGPLYFLPTTEAFVLSGAARLALRVEAELTQGNLPQAVIQMGAFLECLTRERVHALIGADKRISTSLFSKLKGREAIPLAPEILRDYPSPLVERDRYSRSAKYTLSFSSKSLPKWADKLKDEGLKDILVAYEGRAKWRNMFAHGSFTEANVRAAWLSFGEAGLVGTTRGQFGENFVGTARFRKLQGLEDVGNFVDAVKALDRDLREAA